MATKNRHIRGATKDIQLPVHGNVVVEKGDLIIENNTASSVSSHTTADGYGFPVSSLQHGSPTYYANQFAGVAMTGSVSGVTNNIWVATAGQFRFPLQATAGVTTGVIVSGATTAANLNTDQEVVCEKNSGASSVIGRCVKTEAAATNCDFTLLTRYSGVSYFDLV